MQACLPAVKLYKHNLAITNGQQVSTKTAQISVETVCVASQKMILIELPQKCQQADTQKRFAEKREREREATG